MTAKAAPVHIVAENVKLHPSALVCVKLVQLDGDITIGDGTIVNPCARLLATAGPICIGNRVLIEDRALVENTSAAPLTIGDGVTIEADAVVHASVGRSAVVEIKATIESVVGDGMVIGTGAVYRTPTDVDQARAYVPAELAQARTLPTSLQSTNALLELTRKHIRAYQEVYTPFPRPA